MLYYMWYDDRGVESVVRFLNPAVSLKYAWMYCFVSGGRGSKARREYSSVPCVLVKE